MYILSYLRAERQNRWKAMPLARLIAYLVICQGEKLSAAHMTDRAGPFTGLHFFFFNGASSCENLHSSHGSYAPSLEPDLSWNAKSLIQADVCLGQEIWGSSIVIKLLLI